MESCIEDHYTICLPRCVPADILELEEREREERISAGVDPMMMARVFRCQTELMHKHIPTSWMNDARANLSRGYFHTKEGAKEKASDFGEKMTDFKDRVVTAAKDTGHKIETKVKDLLDKSDELSQKFASETNKKVDEMKKSLQSSARDVDNAQREFSVQTNSIASDLTDKIKEKYNGEPTSVDSLEEKERARRINEKIDPVIEGKRHRVESELLAQVKPVN